MLKFITGALIGCSLSVLLIANLLNADIMKVRDDAFRAGVAVASVQFNAIFLQIGLISELNPGAIIKESEKISRKDIDDSIKSLEHLKKVGPIQIERRKPQSRL